MYLNFHEDQLSPREASGEEGIFNLNLYMQPINFNSTKLHLGRELEFKR